MRKITLLSAFALVFCSAVAQKEVQPLQPARIGIFKNGTFFIKREGNVNVADKSFYIKAPEKVLMGTWWVAVGKEASLHSIVVKTDTFKVTHTVKELTELLQTNIGQNITVFSNAANPELRKLTGKLVDFDYPTNTMRVLTATGKTILVKSDSFEWFELNGTINDKTPADSIIAVAKVKLNKEANKTMASTISLERGVQWFPSYLFTIINDKEAKLELKATIATGAEEYRNMPVDIIIGSPEMFYAKILDPVCIDYLSESLLGNGYDNNGFMANGSLASYNYSQAISTSGLTDNYEWNDGDEKDNQKEGQKLEDLFYYQLGNIDLEKNSRIIVPVMNSTVTYSEIYTADLPIGSPSADGENSIQAYHSYLIANNTTAPFTTGPALVIDQMGQPLAQAQLTYTPVKGNCDMQLSKAVDVQIKNEEEESSREKSSVKKTTSTYYEKITTSGNITITNFKDKKIKIRVAKNVNGVFSTADNAGKSRKGKAGAAITEIYWEVEVEAGAKLLLKYDYYNLK
ncbi:MAG: hypothetical protein HOP10_14205 [Chitinophagaceae bacterium]|nr:hypothetical protein [Chitinophagaceae bacterium]